MVVPGPCNSTNSNCECTAMSDCGCLPGFEVVTEGSSRVCRGKQYVAGEVVNYSII